MKNKEELKQWMLTKTSSIKDKFSRTNSKGMEIDSLINDVDDQQNGQKTTFLAKGNPFRVDSRYTYIKTLGLGAYGVVCAAHDTKLGKQVAIKKVAKVFDELTDAKRIIREIRLLRNLQHENILTILDMDEPENYNHFNDVYIVTELLDTDMDKLLRNHRTLLDSHRKFITYQLLKGLKYIHSANILHRDLKPANILITETCDVKICDFGLARYMKPSQIPDFNMTEYVVTRWYRAPELLLATDEYTTAIDMWSVGCVIAELYTGNPIFQGRDVKNQIELICRIIGKPIEKETQVVTTNIKARQFIAGLPDSQRIDFRRLMYGACPAAIDLVERLLQFDPNKRLSAHQALCHPYVADYREPETEIVANDVNFSNLEPPNERDVGREGVRRLMWNEILKFHPSAERKEPANAKYIDVKLQAMEAHR